MPKTRTDDEYVLRFDPMQILGAYASGDLAELPFTNMVAGALVAGDLVPGESRTVDWIALLSDDDVDAINKVLSEMFTAEGPPDGGPHLADVGALVLALLWIEGVSEIPENDFGRYGLALRARFGIECLCRRGLLVVEREDGRLLTSDREEMDFQWTPKGLALGKAMDELTK